MQALQIRPHSRRITSFAIAGLAVLSAGAFSFGLQHQIGSAQASPAAASTETATLSAYVADAIPEATAAREPAMVAPAPKRHSLAPAEAAADSGVNETLAVADAPPAVDATATAPDPPPSREANPTEPPT